MSDTAKSARAAMKAKAQRLGGSDRPLEKVDSSSWSPPELLNSTTKTGARPLTRRAYKSGGKVKGVEAKARADRPARKTGDASLSANSLINRNVKAANAEREGAGKHIGAFKKGGRAKKGGGGLLGGTASVLDPLGSPEMIKDPLNLGKGVRDPLNIDAPLKRGGRAKKCEGGEMKRTKHNTRGGAPVKDPYAGEISTRSVTGPGGKYVTADEIRSGLSGAPMPPKMPDDIRDIRNAEAAASANANMGRKHGGRTKKFMGGPMMQPGGMLAGAGPSGMPAGQGAPGGPTAAGPDPRLGIVPKNAMNFGAGAQGSPYKKGGAVKHSDEAEDKSLIKKMVKGEALKRKEGGGVFSGKGYPFKVPGADGGRTAKAGGGMLEKSKKAMMVANDPHFKNAKVSVTPPEPTQPAPMPTDQNKARGGRTARASGGRTGKGKTNINIVIAAGKGPQGGPPAGLMPPPPPGGGRPVMMPPPPPGGAGAGAPPMPMPIPMPMPMGGAGGPPPGMPPMPRKAGGRITKTAHSYKDMEAGAGSGEGRLQKTEIAKRAMHNSGGKVGHRSYSSYKDMDAGSGGGLGRLEKTEIAAKRSGIQKAY